MSTEKEKRTNKRDSAGSSSSSGTSGGVLGAHEREPDVIVLDIGSGFVKAGWAGEDAPRVVLPTVLLDHHGQALPASVLEANPDRAEYQVGYSAIQVGANESMQFIIIMRLIFIYHRHSVHQTY